MTIRTLHLLRHGETQASLEGVFCGELDVPLSEKGHAQAERVGPQLAKLGLEMIYVSPLQRARETAAPVARIVASRRGSKKSCAKSPTAHGTAERRRRSRSMTPRATGAG